MVAGGYSNYFGVILPSIVVFSIKSLIGIAKFKNHDLKFSLKFKIELL